MSSRSSFLSVGSRVSPLVVGACQDESVLRSAANGSDDPESFDDVQIEWVRATSEAGIDLQ